MRFHYHIPNQPPSGPWTFEELVEQYRLGALGPHTWVSPDSGLGARWRFQELYAQQRGHSTPLPPPAPSPPDPSGLESAATSPGSEPPLPGHAQGQSISDHLLIPLKEFHTGRWFYNRRSLLIGAVGLIPLAILTLFKGSLDIDHAFWAIALYFSVLWAAFFYHAFPAPGVNLTDAAYCFWGSAILCSTVLGFTHYYLKPLSAFLVKGISSGSLGQRWFAWIVGVGLIEEACKAAILFVAFRRRDRLAPQTLLFYGLLAGLGFGIYEGVRYQLSVNPNTSGSEHDYYLWNILRLTSLPFMHAMWTGIAGYFISLAWTYPRHRLTLFIVAIALPAFLHGSYNAFSSIQPILSIIFALFSVLALNLYLKHTMELERGMVQKS